MRFLGVKIVSQQIRGGVRPLEEGADRVQRIIGVDQIIDRLTDRTNGLGSRGRLPTWLRLDRVLGRDLPLIRPAA